MKPCLLLLLLLSACLPCGAEEVAGIERTVVFDEADRFAAWPANEGMWAWGDEILVGFNVAKFEERGEKHSLAGEMETVFSRSLDGGRTWAVERHANVVPAARIGKGAAGRFEGGVDFQEPGFAMKLRGKFFHVSADRGRKWDGPYGIPDFGQRMDARTSYLVTGKDTCLLFIPCDFTDARGKRIRSCVAQMKGGGGSVEFISWIGPDPLDEAEPELVPKGDDTSATMPSVVRMADGRLVCALRKRIKSRKWSAIYESGDEGQTWNEISILERGATNPVALASLGGGKLAAIYGNRRSMPGKVCAKLSKDGGKTWGEEMELRGGGRKWDLGYARATLVPSGEVLAVYYFTTEERPQQHIESLRWMPELKEINNGPQGLDM